MYSIATTIVGSWWIIFKLGLSEFLGVSTAPGKFVNCFISNAIDIQISPHMKDSIAIDCIRLQHMVVIDCIQPSWIFTKLGLSEFLGVSTAPAKNKANRSYRSRFLGPFLGFMWRKTHNMAAILTHFLYFSVIGSGWLDAFPSTYVQLEISETNRFLKMSTLMPQCVNYS